MASKARESSVLKDLNGRLGTYVHHVHELEETKRVLEKQNRELQQQHVAEIDLLHHRYSKEVNALRLAYENEMEQRVQLQDLEKELNEKVHGMETELEELRAMKLNVDEVTQKFKKLEDRHAKLKKEATASKTEITLLHRKRTSIQNHANEVEHRYNLLKKEYEEAQTSFEAQLREMRTELHEYRENRNKDLVAISETHEKQQKQAEQQSNQLIQHKLTEQADTIAQLQATNQSLQQQLDALSEQNQKIAGNHIWATDQLAKVEKQFLDERSDFMQKITTLEAEKQTLLATKQQQQLQLEGLQASNQELEKGVELLQHFMDNEETRLGLKRKHSQDQDAESKRSKADGCVLM